MGALDATTGATRPWAAQERIRTAGLNGGITSLKADDTTVYGSGYAFGSGASFEGTFAADPDGGAIRWVNDCLGDTYDVEPFAGALYSVGHVHDCTRDRRLPRHQPALALAEGDGRSSLTPDRHHHRQGRLRLGLPRPALHRARSSGTPTSSSARYTPDRQAAWAVEGSGDYVVLGGEFPKVNGVAQQGLTRFLKKSVGPHSMKPLYITAMNPVATSTESGTVRIRFGSTWDRDDETAHLRRLPRRRALDRLGDLHERVVEAAAAGLHRHRPHTRRDAHLQGAGQGCRRQRPVDPRHAPPWSSRTPRPPRTPTRSGPTAPSTCGASRTAPPRPWTPSAPPTSPSRAPRPPRASRAAALGSVGGTTSKGYTTFAEPKPDAVTLEAWVKTTSGNGGRIIGLGSSAGNSSSSFDLALYLGNNGRVNLGVRNAANSLVTTTSSQAVNDGQWHHVVGVVDAGGSSVVIDGRRSGRNQNGTGGPALNGYWRVLGDNTSGLANRPTDQALAGTVDEVAVYPTALPIDTVRSHYTAITGLDPAAATPTDTYGARVVDRRPGHLLAPR